MVHVYNIMEYYLAKKGWNVAIMENMNGSLECSDKQSKSDGQE